MKRLLALAIAVGALAFGTVPASADQPFTMECVSFDGVSGAGMGIAGVEGWVESVQRCTGTGGGQHPRAVFPPGFPPGSPSPPGP